MLSIKKIQVDESIKAIHFKFRKEPELIIGNDYFVCFGGNIAAPCVLLAIIDNGKEIPKQIQIGLKDKSARGYKDKLGLYANEIGLTPKEAVINSVSS